MSRIGNNEILIPDGVTVKYDNNTVIINGKLGFRKTPGAHGHRPARDTHSSGLSRLSIRGWRHTQHSQIQTLRHRCRRSSIPHLAFLR